MNRINQLEYIKELFLKTSSICTWNFSKDLKFEESNSSTEMPLRNIFMSSHCFQTLAECFRECKEPIYLFDDLFFLWCAIPEIEEDELLSIYLLGPVFNTYTSDSFLREKMGVQHMSVKSQKTLLDIIRRIPVLPTAVFSHFVCQFYYTLNQQVLECPQIRLPHTLESIPQKREENSASSHNSYYFENILSESVRQGILIPHFSSSAASVQTGLMCPGDPLRQKKDEFIGLITLITRAAIRGGYAPESAYALSDYYVQSMESATDISTVLQLQEIMYTDFVEHVRQVQQNHFFSSFLRDCAQYIDERLTQEIDLEVLASDLGYAKYYLTSRFKKESGQSIVEYITQRRVEYAKALLENPNLSIQEISETLHFSSPSYFTCVFRKAAGLSPTEYRKQFEP